MQRVHTKEIIFLQQVALAFLKAENFLKSQ